MSKTRPRCPADGQFGPEQPRDGRSKRLIWEPCQLGCGGSLPVYLVTARSVAFLKNVVGPVSKMAAAGAMVGVCVDLVYLPCVPAFSLNKGCEELASQFLSQEIDGQALMLLREDHLISTMNIKLGPALKICASINSLRD